jgi:hypothetical protein
MSSRLIGLKVNRFRRILLFFNVFGFQLGDPVGADPGIKW